MAAIFGTDTLKEELVAIAAPPAEKPEGQKPDADSEPAEKPEEPAPADDKKSADAKPAGNTGLPDDHGDQPKHRSDGGFQRRIDQLTRDKRDGLREIEALKARLLAKPGDSPAAAATVEPKRDDFSSEADYYKALGAFGAREEIRKAEDVMAAKQAEQDAEQQQAAHETSLTEARRRYTDFDEVTGREDILMTQAMIEALPKDDARMDVLYHLGKHPEETMLLAKLPPLEAFRAVRKIAAELAPAEPSAKLHAVPKNKPVSQAPDPIPPARGANGTGLKFDPKLATADDPGWKQWRTDRDDSEAKRQA